MKKTVVITGGHITPALAVIQELLKRNNYSVIIYGRTHAFSQAKKTESFEYQEIKKLGLPFIKSSAPRFPHGISIWTVFYPFQLAYAIMQSISTIQGSRPAVIVSFGGYISVPMVIAGWLMHIPIVSHEQTLSPGRANRLLARFSKYICVSWQSTVQQFRFSTNVIVTGNPVRREIRSIIGKKTYNSSIKVIYITGGSTGAHRINTIIESSLQQLTAQYRVIHQCGDSHFNDYERLITARGKLPVNLQKKYNVCKYVNHSDLINALLNADIIIGRSGANTIVEVALLAIPAIFIPLPESQEQEQQKQAASLASRKTAQVLIQEALTPDAFMKAIENSNSSYKSYVQHAKNYSESEVVTLHKMAHARLTDCIDRCAFDIL